LVADGIVGPKTRAALGMPDTGTPFTHRVRLQFLSISLTAVPFNTILAHTQAVYAQYGIKIEFAGGMSLGLDSEAADRLQQVDGTCEWTITDGEYAEILGLGGKITAGCIGVFYVDQFSEDINGCGGHLKNRPACIVAKAGTKYSTAHEIGHVLLGASYPETHSTDMKNLMYRTTTALTGPSTPVLSEAQVNRIKLSPMCVPI
jgi:hypothetical protein